MSIRSVYQPAPTIADNRIHIQDEEQRHLTIARIEKDERLEVFDGKGNVWTVRVDSVEKRETVAVVEDTRYVPPDSIGLTLALALIRMAAFELALEKAVEVGVTRIVPFTAKRSNIAPGARHDRWLRIVIEAAKQSKRYHLPALESPIRFDQVLSIPAVSKIVFAERGGGPLKSALAGSPVLYLIGPEGGWTENELTAAREHGFREVSLGTTILKSETAAIVGASLIQYELEK
jgi:16S rRNA (uracil1498-N3)-methyltransferase